ncbi:hypothetical protein KQ3_01371 [Bacillus cereus B5-2]|nr:hypothetical protein ICS_03519 [Bacillus cereus BAG2O-3]EOQ12430.1 hypothetical protein KQ3_01371 [Bacillus cereus B5-2]
MAIFQSNVQKAEKIATQMSSDSDTVQKQYHMQYVRQ